MTSKGGKFKVLCLHGIGTNSEVFEAQTAALRYQLGDEYHFDFIDGSYPWPAARGIAEVFGDQEIYYSYFDGSVQSVTKAVTDLDEYIAENGPFDAVMGFSLGAALVATLLLRNEKQRGRLRDGDRTGSYSHRDDNSKPSFKCAIFLCGTSPCDWDILETGHMGLLQAKDVSNLIQIPTVHAWSKNDVDYPGQSLQLVQMCNSTMRVEVLHSAGHGVPSQGEELTHIVNAIQNTMVGLNF